MTTILVVDDNEQNVYQLQVLLGGNGYQVASAANGAEALAAARQTPPDLVISDILMPVMDGFALCREWRKDECLKVIPLVFYTATYTDDRDRQFALDNGADRFVVKPEEPEILLKLIREVLAERQGGDGAGPAEPVKSERVFLRQYNQALIRKLEAKLVQLEAARRELERDIAERKRVEEELRFRTLVLDTQQEASLDGILVVSESDQVLSFNRRFIDMWNIPRDLLESRSDARILQSVVGKLVAPEVFLSRVQWLYAHPHETSRDELALVDGRLIDRYSAPMSGTGGTCYGRVWYFRDITEHKRAEEAQRVQSAALSAAANAIVITDREGSIQWVNPAFEALTGFAAAEALGRNPRELVKSGQHDKAFYQEMWETILAGGIWRGDVTNCRKDGSLYTEEMAITPVRDDSGAIVRFVAVKSDVSERRRLEEALRASRQRLISIYDTVGDAIFLVAIEADGGFRFESINKRFAATTGVPAEAVVGKRIEEVIPAGSLPLVLDRYRQAVREKAVVRWEETSDYPVGRLTGEVSVAPLLDERGQCTHLVGAVHDITARRGAEEMLRQSQKLESIGRLAGGVAHDFNNLLGVILGYGELMRVQIGGAHPARPRLEQVIQAAQRAAGLTRQLLAFSRKQVMTPKLLDLGAVVSDTRCMLDRVVGEDLEIAVLSAEGLGAVLADSTQIEQVIMNLVVNARDAMPKGGRITIETANRDFDETYASAHPPALPGRFVMLAVSDTGTGMDADTQRRIFEPFFTTKAPGEGTGLGLATVYGIVKQMDGYIWVYSEVGRGTCFKVYLPRVEEAVVAEAPSAPQRTSPRGHETVLVVEDSEALRNLIQELLAEQGYKVLSVTDGEAALALIQDGRQRVDLVLTDVVMPRLGGVDLVKRLRATHPHLRVVYMSGYTSGAISRSGALDEGAVLLEKPFTAEKLAQTVRLAFERRPADGLHSI